MKNDVTIFQYEGTVYTQTKPGYYFKTTGGTGKNGQALKMRIPKHAFEAAYENYLQGRKDAADAEDTRNEIREEDAWDVADNLKDEKPEVTISGFWDGDTDIFTVKVGDEVVLRTYSHEEAMEEARKLGWVAPGEKEDKKEAGKPKKARRSKDIAFEGHGITLTAKQVDFIKHIPDTCFYEHGLESAPWCDVLADEIGGQFAGKPMTVGAMISTLREKDLIHTGVSRVNGKKAKFFEFTDLGKKVAKNLGLE